MGPFWRREERNRDAADRGAPQARTRDRRRPAPDARGVVHDHHPQRLAVVTTLVLFDIDGTLLLTGGAGLRAMTLAFEELFGVADAFDGISMPGRTDTSILADAAAAHHVPANELDRFRDVYLSHLVRELERPGPSKQVMPGIRPLLDALAARSDAYVALLTGNYEQAARSKLEYFDLWQY